MKSRCWQWLPRWAEGQTMIRDAQELKVKESNRLQQ
jgi:5-enolpyruvylshikimate-3-phosphate synthase